MDGSSQASHQFVLRIWHGPGTQHRAALRRLEGGDWTYMPTPDAMLAYLHGTLPIDGACAPAPRLRIFAFGRFSVLKDDVPPPCGHKAQKRCYELLKALVALGGRGVDERRLADALWPDAEADRARQSLKTTLHRLRKLIGAETIVLREGRLTLAAERCWLDSWELESHLDRALSLPATASSDELAAQLDAALHLYRGPLMADDDSALVLFQRDRLRSKLLRTLTRVAHSLLAAGKLEPCVALVQRGLDIDPLEERLYETLMRAHLGSRRHADALLAYERCATRLRVALGARPSGTLDALRAQARAMDELPAQA